MSCGTEYNCQPLCSYCNRCIVRLLLLHMTLSLSLSTIISYPGEQILTERVFIHVQPKGVILLALTNLRYGNSTVLRSTVQGEYDTCFNTDNILKLLFDNLHLTKLESHK